MPISPSNVIFVYRSVDPDSLAVAQAYQSAYNLDSAQLVPIPCSAIEILPDEATFNTEVLEPIQTALSTSPLNSYVIWCIILGYNVPGGFYSDSSSGSIDGNVISSVSRISRMNFSFSQQLSNYLYNRANFHRYNSTDAQFAYITARIDALSPSLCLNMIKNASILNKQNKINGTFYLDPYSGIAGSQAQQYQDDILYFADVLLPRLNLQTYTSTFIDPYVGSILPSVVNDCFVWSTYPDRASSSFFQDTNTTRVFFYNADTDGAFTIKNDTDGRWTALAIDAGYVSTASSMSDPTESGYLNTYAFFNTLLNGGTLGEAYLFSCPYLDWTNTFFGDPLVTITFPVPSITIPQIVITENESWRLASVDLATSIAYLEDRSNCFYNITQTILGSKDTVSVAELLTDAYSLQTSSQNIVPDFQPLVMNFFQYAIKRFNTNINNFLDTNNYQISQLLANFVSPTINFTNNETFPEGYWEVYFVLANEVNYFVNYNFIIQISDCSDFSNIILTISTLDSVTNWFYEKTPNVFFPLPSTGIGSNYVGNRIKYESTANNYLDRFTIYYVRILQNWS